MLVIPANGANTFRWIDVPSDTTYRAGTGLQLSSANQFSISNGGVDTTQIANAAITAAKIETANAITGDRLLGLGNDLELYWLPASSGEPAANSITCLLYTSPSPRDRQKSRMPSSA